MAAAWQRRGIDVAAMRQGHLSGMAAACRRQNRRSSGSGSGVAMPAWGLRQVSSLIGRVPLSPNLKNNAPHLGRHELLVVQRMQALSARGRAESFGRRTLPMIASEATEQSRERMATCKLRSQAAFS